MLVPTLSGGREDSRSSGTGDKPTHVMESTWPAVQPALGKVGVEKGHRDHLI